MYFLFMGVKFCFPTFTGHHDQFNILILGNFAQMMFALIPALDCSVKSKNSKISSTLFDNKLFMKILHLFWI